MEKKYSVLMSVYINEKPDNFILSIESMLNQTIVPDQIVIVEDGPLTKELKEVIDSYSEKHKKVITNVILPVNMGLGLALNEGLKACRNDLVARMDTDDISLPNRCELQLKRFSEKKELVILGTQNLEFEVDYNKPKFQRKVPEKYEDILKFSKRRSPFNHPTVMYKKSYLDRVGGYNHVLRNEDYDLFYRMLSKGFYAENLSEALLLFRTDKDNYKRRKSWENSKGYIIVSNKMYRDNYISLFDFTYVIFSQLVFLILPIPLLKIVSENLLRKKIK